MLRRQRNQNVAEIMDGARVGNTLLDFGSQFTHAFWMGDLNYRIDLKSLPEFSSKFVALSSAGNKTVEWDSVANLVSQLASSDSSSSSTGAASAGKGNARVQAARALETLQRADELQAEQQAGECALKYVQSHRHLIT